jgi:hypothetical protein
MTEHHSPSHMQREVRAIPEAVARLLAEGSSPAKAAAETLRRLNPRVITTIARGSSDHAATYLKYAIELSCGVPVSSTGPSVSSVYGASMKLADAATLAISQSGQSPDIIGMAQTARDSGSFVIALTNTASSPLAGLSAQHIDILAGPELSIAATKSFVSSIVAGLLVLAHWQDDHARETLDWTTPSLKMPGSGGGDHGEHGEHTSSGSGHRDIDIVLWAARTSGIDAKPVEISLPTTPDGAWKVAEVDRSWPTQVDAVAIQDGAVVSSVKFADYPVAAKLSRWGIDAHMGVLFGWPNQLLLLLIGGGLVTLVVLGYRMWWKRRPTSGFGRPTPRGQWRKVPPVALAGLGLGTLVVGWFVPLLGISLVAFLVIDLLLGRRVKTA